MPDGAWNGRLYAQSLGVVRLKAPSEAPSLAQALHTFA
jgi:hypothetical protein